jgi:hypothetical protein
MHIIKYKKNELFTRYKLNHIQYMIYIGYPVRIMEAYRIFGQTMKYDLYNYKNDTDLSKYLQKYQLDLYSTDKGQHIIGFEIKEFNDMWNHFTNVDESVILIMNNKRIFKERMALAKADTTKVTIEYMESGVDDAETFDNPEPYIMSWNN